MKGPEIGCFRGIDKIGAICNPPVIRHHTCLTRLATNQSRGAFAEAVGLSERTLSRRAGEQSIVPNDVAERALRIARIEALAEFVLEDAQAGREWLDTPQP